MSETIQTVHTANDGSPNDGSPINGHEPSDAELLRRFLAAHDQPAFEALVRRHGPMVHGVCRRVLADAHDAEDAFQATFLVLVRKASSLKRPELLANWLYGTAFRIARKVRSREVERHIRESRVDAMSTQASLVDLEWNELRIVLDEELNRLPEQLRAPLVLCYLCGQTNVEAARRLGWPTGSIAGRLAQAREALRKRLNRRGLSLSAGLLALLLAEKAVEAGAPESLMAATVASASMAPEESLPAALAGLVDEASQGLVRHAGVKTTVVSAAVVSALALLMLWTAVREAAGRGRDVSALTGRGAWSLPALFSGYSNASPSISTGGGCSAAAGCKTATDSALGKAGCLATDADRSATSCCAGIVNADSP